MSVILKVAVLLAILLLPVLLLVLLFRQRRQLRHLQLQLEELREALAYAREAPNLAAQERQRLLADLHDDVGGKLLALMHAVEHPEHADLARAVMQDFRDVVSRSQLDACTLLQALGQIREETGQRLEAMGGVLDWQQAANLPDPELDEARVLHLFRIAREALTNAFRHARATHVRVRIGLAEGSLLLDVTDNGPGFVGTPLPPGRGTRSMRSRAQELQGTIDWQPGTMGGTKVVLAFPLPAAAGDKR